MNMFIETTFVSSDLSSDISKSTSVSTSYAIQAGKRKHQLHNYTFRKQFLR